MSTKLTQKKQNSKVTAADFSSKKKARKRLTHKQRPPFRVLFGRVNTAGSGYVFDKPLEYQYAQNAFDAAKKELAKEHDSLREIIICIVPQEK